MSNSPFLARGDPVSRGTRSRLVEGRGLHAGSTVGQFEKNQIVAVKLPILRMASDLGEADLVAVLKRGDLLRLNNPHPHGGGKVFYVTVLKTANERSVGRAGIVHTNWVEPAFENHGASPPLDRPQKPPPEDVTRLTVETYVDNFKEVIYDPDYRVKEERYGPTNWLQVIYDDGTEIAIHFSKIADKAGIKVRDALAKAKRGDGGRVFPAEMNPQTTPRLWAVKQAALEQQAGLTNELIKGALSAIVLVITMPAMPVGLPPSAARPTVRRVPRSRAAGGGGGRGGGGGGGGGFRFFTLKQMGEFLRNIWRRNPILQRLANARGLKGQTQSTELMNILNQFQKETGITTEVVKKGAVQAVRGAGDFGSLRSKPGFYQIEEQVFKDPARLWNELKHGFASHYTGVPNAPVLENGLNAMNFLEIMVEGGGTLPSIFR